MRALAKKTLQGNASGNCGSQLVISHGLLGSSTNWMTVARHLGKQELLRPRLKEIHMLDMRNHGESPHFDVHTNAAMSSDIELFILQQQQQWKAEAGDRHEDEDEAGIVLMGHSMGGFAVMGSMLRRANEGALLLQSGIEGLKRRCERGDYYGWVDAQGNAEEMRTVNRLMDLPELQHLHDTLYDCGGVRIRTPRVKAAIIVDIAPSTTLGTRKQYGQSPDEALSAMMAVDLSRVHTLSDGNVELERAGVASKAMRDFLLTNLRVNSQSKTAQWRCNLPVLHSDYELIALGVRDWFLSAEEAGGSRGECEMVAPIKSSLPTLFVFGKDSPYNTTEDRRLIPRFFSNVEEVEVEGSGHFVHYEKMQEFVNIITPFLARYL
uniref:Uncharacterized protein TCIL3000_11_3640 n=1 Tax=Trypanosoma congolense (strain IL3000) TaxID=1068625 RepID=G0UZZ5_TRYCI|nr:unnamed protein product [Trypanosoma congolense IL3000]